MVGKVGQNELEKILANYKTPDLDKMMKTLKKDIDKLYSISNKTWTLVALSGFAIAFVSSMHGVTEAWGWKIAEPLITIDGLILGFVILALTILSTKETVQSLHESMVQQSLDEIKQEHSIEEKTPSEEKAAKILALAIRPVVELGVLRALFSVSIICLLVSVGLSLCLFGVNENTASPLGLLLFSIIYAVAIVFSLGGIYVVTKGLFVLLERGSYIFWKRTLDLLAQGLELGNAESNKKTNEVKLG